MRILLAALSLGVWLTAPPARAQTQIKSRVMVLVDTSGSMVGHFTDNNSAGGDGDLASLYTDVNQANKNYYPGTLVGGKPDGANSRLYGAKAALRNVIDSTGDVDFGLMRYAPDLGCANPINCCNFNAGACQTYAGYINNKNKITWHDGCGTIQNGQAIDGGQVLVSPIEQGSNTSVYRWVDNVEDFRAGGANGFPLNGELRANGLTPLAGAVRSAENDWFAPIVAASKGGNCDPKKDPLCDPQIDCRPYALVVMTDGADTCENDPVNAPPAAVAQMTAQNPKNPVATYVVGLAFINGDPAIGVLNQMAAKGGTGSARFANSQQDIEAALADILAASVRVEICNGKDDNCNAQIDEGFDKGGKCSAGVGACLRNGIKKCTQDGSGTRCCVDDGKPDGPCVPLVAGPIAKEICNGIDDDCNGIVDDPPACMPGGCTPTLEICDGLDNDCDGVIDDNLVDVGQPCGLNVGQCVPGQTVCVPAQGKPFPDPSDHLICVGATGPSPEICDGVDNDCDGVVDGMTRACYDGDPKLDNVGICHDGQQKCTLGMWGGCVGEVLPGMEVCNGLDDDCDGQVDDVPGVGDPCCPSMRCGVGACVAGAMKCSGGSVQCVGGQGPTPEVCNGVDDDCNGKVDDVVNLGRACVAQSGCAGVLACDLKKMQIGCEAVQMNCGPPPMGCANDPNLGKPCGNPKGLPPPCLAGKWICKNGMLLCDGAVGPAGEVCDGVDNNCDGQVDNGAVCPPDFACYRAQCDPLCRAGEFPCPGGFHPLTVGPLCVCAPDKDCKPACKPGLTCDPKTGACVDPCAAIKCPTGFRCADGACQGCEKFGCAGACERCDKASHMCAKDKCCGVTCGDDQFCDPATGGCEDTCRFGCASGLYCKNGKCVQDPCYGKQCAEGQACDPQSGVGDCVADPCNVVACSQNLACCAGACTADPCGATACPSGTVCRVNPISCRSSCETRSGEKPDEVVGAGGGFLGCALAPRRPPPLLALLFLALALAARRRR